MLACRSVRGRDHDKGKRLQQGAPAHFICSSADCGTNDSSEQRKASVQGCGVKKRFGRRRLVRGKFALLLAGPGVGAWSLEQEQRERRDEAENRDKACHVTRPRPRFSCGFRLARFLFCHCDLSSISSHPSPFAPSLALSLLASSGHLPFSALSLHPKSNMIVLCASILFRPFQRGVAA